MTTTLPATGHHPEIAYDRLLSTSEVAAIFRLKRPTIAAYIRAGKLTARQTPGGHYRIAESEVRALLAAGESS